MSWNIQKPGDYINGPLVVASTINATGNIQTDAELYTLGGRVSLYRTAGASYLDWSSGQSLVWRTVTSVGGAGPSELMRLNSTGLGIGTSPSQRLSVSGNISLTNTAATSIGMTNATSGITYTLFSASPSGNGFTGFGIYDGSAYIMRTNQQGDFGVGVLPDNTKSACLQLKSGVSFPSAQVASADANTLDDYEEGTWTGTLKGSGSDPTTPVTATGKYTKIGRKVYVEIAYNGFSNVGASGAIFISGLPFAAAAQNVGSLMMTFAGTFTNGSLSSFIASAATNIETYVSTSNGAVAAPQHNAGTSRSLWACITYTV